MGPWTAALAMKARISMHGSYGLRANRSGAAGGLKAQFRFSDGAGAAARALLIQLTDRHAEELVRCFYEVFLADAEAAPFLNSAIVHERLAKSLHRWLGELVACDVAADQAAFDAQQRKIGEVHARIKVPIHLVIDGVNMLKIQLAAHIARAGAEPETALAAVVLLNHLADYAMYRMSEAYVQGVKRSVRMDEAYRLFALGQDASIERESQRAALMEWSQSIFLAVLAGRAGEIPLLPISQSHFGLWVRHRGALMFAGMPPLAEIELLMQRIDTDTLPGIVALGPDDREAMAGAIAQLSEIVEQIKYQFVALFQGASHLSGGRDALTQMLNRRFMPAILSQEVSYAAESKLPLSLIMIDIDHFKEINDSRGHPAGDVVIREVAEIVLRNVRASDFAFRYGGEEFLLALVETSGEAAAKAAERIRRDVEAAVLTLPDGSTLRATVSIGVADFSGHPDHEFLIQRADAALYLAKEGGRNRVHRDSEA
jgi:diguanylate cyclase